MWYYSDDVKKSIRRFKFYGSRHYGPAYGRLLGMKILKDYPDGFDLITWVPVGFFRKLRRGYDQSRILADFTAEELGFDVTPLLKKVHNNPPQSSIRDAAKRRANVLGVYQVIDTSAISGKRILLLDDVITSGATCSECAKILALAGAKEVSCAAIAAATQK